MEISKTVLDEVTQAFQIGEEPFSIRRYGSGHINDTFLLENGDKKYILQRINTSIFRDPVSLMWNIRHVTDFLRKKIVCAGGDPERETLNLVSAKDGTDYYIDRNNNYWRIYRFITDAVSFDLVRRPEDFYQSGLAFGHFQRMLADYPAEELFETIPDFHNTPKRYADFCRAVEEDAAGRVSGVKREIEFFMERHEDYDMAVREHREGSLPLRVTHNDTKLNNIMIDSRTGQALCIIDLDTVMPGFSIFDFGDSIRFGANTAEEDERDLGKVSFSIMLYETYCRGFLRGCAGSLTKTELEMLPQGARLMTLECGMRFLADYLQGDIYFRTDREGQNLDRARTQIAMTADMEKKWEEMSSVTRETAAAVTADGR